MLLNVNLRADLFGNYFIIIDNKVSLQIKKRDYEDLSHHMIKNENNIKIKLKNYDKINNTEVLEICKLNASCSNCPFSDENNKCILVVE